jgi:AcrR family transcriptional regulator
MGFTSVTAEYKGRGDPQRSLALLWRTKREPTRGPKPSLAIEQIIDAAIDIADAEGLPAVTMRRVAEQLSVGAMSLYTYVPGKAELLDIMLDQVYGEKRIADDPANDWRARLEAHARADWELCQRHPWVLQVSEARSLLGPNEIAQFESALRAVSGLGLSGREMVSIVSLVTSYVRGAAQVAIDAARVAEQTGVTDEQWWEARAPILDQYFDPANFPTLASIDIAGGFDPAASGVNYHLQLALESFEFGLQRVLDGIAVFIQQRAVDPSFRAHL